MLDVRPSLRPLCFLSVALSFAACSGTGANSLTISQAQIVLDYEGGTGDSRTH